MAQSKHKNNTNKVRQNPKEKEQNTDSKATHIQVQKPFRTQGKFLCCCYTKIVSKGFEEIE